MKNEYEVLSHLLTDEDNAILNDNKNSKISTFGYELVDMTFKLMAKSNDTQSVVNPLLKMIADYYDLSVVSIKEVIGNPKSVSFMYEYIRHDSADRIHKKKTYTMAEWREIVNKYDKGIYKNIDDSESGRRCNKIVKSILQIPMYAEECFIGTIDFVDFYKERSWDEYDIKILEIFTKIICVYLLDMEAFQNLDKRMDEMYKMDHLTGFDNYDVFLKELGKQMCIEDEENRIYIVYSDIQHFKYINETYGYDIGNEMLKTLGVIASEQADRLIGASRIYSDHIVVAIRIKEDLPVSEFMVKLAEVNKHAANRLQEMYGTNKITINTGVYIVNSDIDNPETAVSNANLARKHSKRISGKSCILFSESMMNKIKKQVRLISELPEAIKSKNLVVYYQPKVYCESGSAAGAEALIRWIKPDGSFMYPDDFIPVFEENGSIIDVDYFVYREVFKHIRECIDLGKKVVPVSMNVSRVHLQNDGIIDYIKKLFNEYKIPPELVEFELTENIYIDNYNEATKFIAELKDMKVKVSMDDFGSGYSSLNLLSNIPIDILKIDKAFLKNGKLKENDKIILSCIIDMAKKLGIKVLCEGVENLEQSEFLNQIHCDIIQGYYYGAPMDVNAFEAYVDANN